MIKDKIYLRYYNVLIFLIILIPIIAIILPYKNPILFAFILSFTLYPLYKFIRKYFKSQHLSAYIVLIILIFLIMLPFGIMCQKLSTDVQNFYETTKEKIEENENLNNITEEKNNENPIKLITSKIETKYNLNEYFLKFLDNAYSKIGNLLFEKGSVIIFTIPSVVLSLFIILFLTYYLLIDGHKFVAEIGKLFPVPQKHKKEIINKFKNLISGVLYGQIFIAIIQGTIAGVIYFFVGMESALFWGLITAIVAILPVVGTAIVWFPASLIMIFNGLAIENDTILVVRGIVLMTLGIFLISTIDNLLRPKIVSSKTQEHPTIILIGLIGGVYIFGIAGIFIGPVILSSCLFIFKLYVSEIYGTKNKKLKN
jgi:predicted PurR-regulated permease PerM